MKTPQQIIDSLPEGNRKRACIILDGSVSRENISGFWAYMDCEAYSKAACFLEDFAADKNAGKVLADMIWEG